MHHSFKCDITYINTVLKKDTTKWLLLLFFKSLHLLWSISTPTRHYFSTKFFFYEIYHLPDKPLRFITVSYAGGACKQNPANRLFKLS